MNEFSLCVGIMAFVCVNALQTPSSSALTTITMEDNKGRSFALVFGTDVRATDGFDTELGEFPIPPPPPPGLFEARFVDRPTHRRVPGDGSYKDIRPFVRSAQIDTFIVRFQTADDAYPVRFRWEPSQIVTCDSMIIRYKSNGNSVSVNMAKASMLMLNDTDISTLQIINYGVR